MTSVNSKKDAAAATLRKKITKEKPIKTHRSRLSPSHHDQDCNLAYQCRVSYGKDPNAYVKWLLKEQHWKREYFVPLSRDADYELLVEMEQIGRHMLEGCIWVYNKTTGKLVNMYVDMLDAEEDKKYHTNEQWASFELCEQFKDETIAEDFINWMHETIGESC